MSENVGAIHYTVDLDTGKMIDGQRKVQSELNKTTGSLDGFSSKLSGVASAISVLAIAMSALKSAQMADDMRMLGAKVEVAAGNIEAGAAAMAALEAISKRTSTSVAANAEVFTRLNQSILQMGGTQQDTLNITELLGKAIRVSGASAVEAKSAMLQFGQALGSGKLAGDELRSLMENAPYLMRQLADGIGVPVGALKQLGEDGELTADVVTNALSKAATQIDADFQKFPQTIASSMDVAMDAAGRANLALDDLTGTSAALTGVIKGTGEVLDELAIQFNEATGEADELGKNESIKTWADAAKLSLSYVIDAFDGVTRAVQITGKWLGSVSSLVVMNLKGDFAEAKAAGLAFEKDISDLMNKPLAGQRMRDQFASGAPRSGPANGATGTIKGTTGGGNKGGKPKGKGAGQKFDEAGFLAGLRKEQASEINAVNEVESEKLRIAQKYLDEKKISVTAHSEAVTLITLAAEEDRAEIMRKTQEQIDSDRRASDKEAEDARKKASDDQQRAIEYGAQLTKAINPVDALRQEYEAKLELVTQYEQMMALAGVDATLQGQLARTQITNEHELQRKALAEQTFRSQGEAQAFLMDSINALSATATSSIMGLLNGTMSAQDAMRALAGTVMNEAVSALVQVGIQQIKNALLGDTLLAADKAKKAAMGMAYAASVGAQVAGMSALAAQNAFAATAAIPIIGPGLAPAAAAAAGAMAAGLGAPALATAPLAGARQYGGPVSSGGLYRVNETGAPEMFTGSNGQQYMMPTKSGSVTAADKIGQNVQWNVIINNAPPGSTSSVDNDARTVTVTVAEVANQIRSNSGPVWSALRGSSNVQGRM